MRREPIDSFTGDYRFLSNFYSVEVKYDGVSFPSCEHAYQAAKTEDKGKRRKFREGTAGVAKREGRRLILRPGWEGMKLDIMLDLLRQKFAHPHLRRVLLETEDAELIEGNTWNDRFWGQCDGTGLNHLGKLLMRVRDEIRAKAE